MKGTFVVRVKDYGEVLTEGDDKESLEAELKAAGIEAKNVYQQFVHTVNSLKTILKEKK
jgi:predicted RNase H-like HicB family nuclease